MRPRMLHSFASELAAVSLHANATHRQRWQHPEAGTCPWQGHLADAKEEAADALDRALMAEAEGAETRNQLALLTAHTQQLQAGLARGGSAAGAADELQEAHDQAAQAQQQVSTAWSQGRKHCVIHQS